MRTNPSFDMLRAWAGGGPEPVGPAFSFRDDRGFGVLHALAEEEASSEPDAARFAGLCREAISRGANPHAAESEIGNTPLHWCCRHPAPGCAEVLILSGASLISNRAGETPDQIAQRLLGPFNSMNPQRLKKLLEVQSIIKSQRTKAEIALALRASQRLAANLGPVRL